MKKVLYYMVMTYRDELWTKILIGLAIFVLAYHGDLIFYTFRQHFGFNLYFNPFMLIFMPIWIQGFNPKELQVNNSFVFAESINMQFIFRYIDFQKYTIMAFVISFACFFAKGNFGSESFFDFSFWFILAINTICFGEIDRNMRIIERKNRWNKIDTGFMVIVYIGILLFAGVPFFMLGLLFDLPFDIMIFGGIFVVLAITFHIHRRMYKTYLDRRSF